MTPSVFFALLLACALPFNSAQSSCNGQCGGEYNRGYMCQCDYDCLTHEECCIDYESQCTTSDSCKGRCGESFKRGRLCDCDPDCARYKKCCPDYNSQCAIEEPEPEPPQIQPTDEPEMTPNPQEELSEDLSDDQPMPLFTPEPELQDEQEDDVKGETWPDLPVPSPDTGSEDPEASPYPEDPEAGLVDPEATANPDDPEETPASESTGGSEFSPTETASSDPLDPTLNTNPQPTDTEDDPEKEAILKGDYTPFPEELDTEATPGSEGTPPAANPNPSTAEPANETPAETTDSSDPEGQPYSSSSPSAADPTLPRSTSEPTPASPVAPQSSDQASPSSEPQPGPTPAEDTPELLPEGQSELDPEGQEAESKNTVPDESEPTPSNLQDPNVASEAPASESGPESKPGRGATPNNFNDNSVPQTGDLATRLTIDPAGQEEGDEAAPEETTSNSMKLSPAPTPAPTPVPVPVPIPTTKPTQNKLTEKIKPSKPTEKPKPKSTQPNTLTDINQALGTDNSRDYQADEHNDTNICSGRPVGAVTTLRNGTVVVFRGHYFWVMDSNRMAGPAHRITDVWGVPSPIDTVFTRCNCQGKTYFFKGANYWRFENSMMDMGFPKLISVGFNGLRGQITAALSVPEYRKRKESVYFFKGGGLVQKYSYQSGTSPTCNRKAHNSVYTVHNRIARQAVSMLGQEINIRLTWRGFPSTVTSAVSIPTHRKPEGYNYYLLSRSKYYNVNMRDERPFIATPPVSATPQKNSAKDFLNCPKEV
ncbi:proteoglycan 4-like isoform X1 [Oncorhynchus nerka]|uniref:proteoglycan 4-like isoform X1 n=1 Tax=Oncorhynchus nerka TaxID=8023 RepID=UPI001130C27F|nr:proteoglycan 4-like isoform X1 [Oncorhynchus nerka]